MAQVWIPPTASRELVEERKRREAKALLLAHVTSVCEKFNEDLRRIDEGLQMVFIPDWMPLDVVAAGARPGRYNLIREDHKGGPLTFIPIVGPDGEFVEPGSHIFDLLNANDWQNPRVIKHRKELQAKIADAKRKAEEEEMRRLDEEVIERYKAYTRTQVLMSPDVRWAQNSAGRRRSHR